MKLKILPMVFPRLSLPTVSTQSARPIVQTKAAEQPWRSLATTNVGTLFPMNSSTVASNKAVSPRRKGPCLVDVLSARIPAIGEKITDAPA
jgi:hypothetical protein